MKEDDRCCRICNKEFETVRKRSYRRRSKYFGIACLRCCHRCSITASRQNKRAKNLGRNGRISTFEWMYVLFENKFTCACCKSNKHLTCDHIIPLSKGGDNTIENIQPLCISCHQIKDNIVPSARSKGRATCNLNLSLSSSIN